MRKRTKFGVTSHVKDVTKIEEKSHTPFGKPETVHKTKYLAFNMKHLALKTTKD